MSSMPEIDADASATPLALTARILIVDQFGSAGIEALRSFGCDVIHNGMLTAQTLARAVADLEPDVLIAQTTSISQEVFSASERLGLVICTGASIDRIDVDAASQRGVFVAHSPGRTAAAVAELAWGLILACDRRLPEQISQLRSGNWDSSKCPDAAGLMGRTLGIVGLGQVGQEIARRGLAFGMHVVAWSRHITEERCDALGVDYCANLVNLAKLSDVVTVSVSATEETAGLLGDKFFNALRPGATVVNTSLGRTINEEALLNAVRTKGIRAGLDLHESEEVDRSRPTLRALLQEPFVYGTSQSGAMTSQARDAADDEVVRTVRQWLDHGTVAGCVNRTTLSSATTLIHVRLLNRPGVLAGIFEVLGRANINVEEMENVICAGGDAAIARIHVNTTPTQGQIEAIRRAPHVLGVTVQAIRNSPGNS